MTIEQTPDHTERDAALRLALDLEDRAGGLEAALVEVRAQAQAQRAYAAALGAPVERDPADLVDRLSAGLAAELNATLAALPPAEQHPLRAASVAAYLAGVRVETMTESDLATLRKGLGGPPLWSRAHAMAALTSAALSRALSDVDDGDGLKRSVEADRRSEAPPLAEGVDGLPDTAAAAPRTPRSGRRRSAKA